MAIWVFVVIYDGLNEDFYGMCNKVVFFSIEIKYIKD
jgi:hypothetical protein